MDPCNWFVFPISSHKVHEEGSQEGDASHGPKIKSGSLEKYTLKNYTFAKYTFQKMPVSEIHI